MWERFSSSAPQPKLPDNYTIQTFVRAYVDEYLGKYAMSLFVCLLFFCDFVLFVRPFQNFFVWEFWNVLSVHVLLPFLRL